MTERKFKDQFVIALLEDLAHPEAVLSHARQMAQMLQKGLILCHVGLDPAAVEPRLQELQKELTTHHSPLTTTYMALKGTVKEAVAALPEMGAVLFVVQARKRLFKDFAQCKIAFLTVQSPLTTDHSPLTTNTICFSVDYKKESKEKFLWASYFARFGHCRLTACHYQYRDSGLRYKCGANLKFMDKLYGTLSIAAEHRAIPRHGAYTDCAILKEVSEIDLLVATTTQERDMLEYLAGTQEDRTLFNPRRIPVLYLNPRDDIYVLCD